MPELTPEQRRRTVEVMTTALNGRIAFADGKTVILGRACAHSFSIVALTALLTVAEVTMKENVNE